MGHDTETGSAVAGWFAGRLPQEWTAVAAPRVTVDREEVVVVLAVAEPDGLGGADAASHGNEGDDGNAGVDGHEGVDGNRGDEGAAAARAEALAGRIRRFREETREARIEVAREAEHRFGRKVAWGVVCGEREELFTHLAVPVMTRLRQPQRQVLDTLVEAGVARSRAHALAWCVRLVGEHADEWLGQLRGAMEQVREVREAGPGL